jgi:hypothetical protein
MGIAYSMSIKAVVLSKELADLHQSVIADLTGRDVA